MSLESDVAFGVTTNNKFGMIVRHPLIQDYEKEFENSEAEEIRDFIDQAIGKKGNYYVLETKMSVVRHNFIQPLTEDQIENFDNGDLTQCEMFAMLSTESIPITEVISCDIVRVQDDKCITGVVE